MQISGGSGGSSSPIQLDISKTPDNVGGTKTYGTGGNTMKVTRMNDVTVGSGSTVKFNFYIHTLLAGGPFTLNKEIKNGASTTAGTLQGETTDISDVYEVYYYKNSSNNGALKIKTSIETKIFYKEGVNSAGAWAEYTGTNPPDELLKPLVNEIKEEFEI